MKISDVMTRDVRVLSPQDTLQQAAQVMKDMNIGSVPICDGQRLLGMLTDRDITIRATADGKDPKTTKTFETMTPEIIYAYEDQDAQEAAKIMQDQKIRRLPILNRNKKLVGILALGDVSVDVDKDKLSGRTLEDISKPSKPDRGGQNLL